MSALCAGTLFRIFNRVAGSIDYSEPRDGVTYLSSGLYSQA